MNLAYEAMIFARLVHSGQQRKYTSNPYADHLAEVAGIVAAVAERAGPHVLVEHQIAVSWLHDCIEDRAITRETLVAHFGSLVADGVMLLSDLEEGNRVQRKAASRARLAAAPGWVQTIKCADLISNTSSIVMHDPTFAVVYLDEKRQLIDVMKAADPRLLAMARAQVEKRMPAGSGA